MKTPDFRRFGKCAVVLGIVVVVAIACGDEEDEDPAKKTGTGGSKDKAGGVVVPVVSQRQSQAPVIVVAPLTTVDKELFAQKAFSVLDDATDAIADDAVFGLSLLEEDSVTRAHKCQVGEDGAVIVEALQSGAATQTADLPKRVVSVAMTATGSDTRRFRAPDGQTIACTAEDGVAHIPWANPAVVAGLTVATSTDKGMDKTRTFSTKASGAKLVTADSWNVVGTRETTFSVPQPEATDGLRARKTITSNVVRTKTFTLSTGVLATTRDAIATSVGAPLEVDVVRSALDGKLKTKTIASGTLVASDDAANRRVEIKLANLVFELSGAHIDRCQPVSGQLTGTIYEKVGTTVLGTFFVTFGAPTDSGIGISFTGEAAVRDFPDYAAKGCDLERES